MKFVNFYRDQAELNFGTVVSFYNEDGDGLPEPDMNCMVSCDVIGSVHVTGCLGFIPRVGDKVELFVDQDGDVPGWFLRLASRANLSHAVLSAKSPGGC